MWFTFYHKMICYEMSFPLTLILKCYFVKILLLMFISISISLKTPNILENKPQVSERSDYTITIYNNLYYNEPKIRDENGCIFHLRKHRIRKVRQTQLGGLGGTVSALTIGYLAFQTMLNLQIPQSFCAINMPFHCCVSYKVLLFL